MEMEGLEGNFVANLTRNVEWLCLSIGSVAVSLAVNIPFVDAALVWNEFDAVLPSCRYSCVGKNWF